MKNLGNLVSLLFIAKGTPELHEILKEFLQTMPHMQVWIISMIRQEKLAPCYVIPSNDYTGKIIHKIMCCMVPEVQIPIVQTTYYPVGILDKGNSYHFAQSNELANLRIILRKEDYENYLSYA